MTGERTDVLSSASAHRLQRWALLAAACLRVSCATQIRRSRCQILRDAACPERSARRVCCTLVAMQNASASSSARAQTTRYMQWLLVC